MYMPGGTYDMYNNCSNFGAYIHIIPKPGIANPYDYCVGPGKVYLWPGNTIQTAYTKASC